MSILLTHRRYFAQQALYLVSLNVNEFINPLDTLASELIVGIKNVFPTIQKTVIKIKLENPPSHIKADYAFSTFLISDLIGVNPLTVAEKIVENFSKNSLKLSKRIFAAGPYVNIELDKQIYQQEVLNHILSENNEFGTKSVKNPRAIIINYYSSNFSPNLKINDLRALLIGRTIGEIYKHCGNDIYHKYYFADWNKEDIKSQIQRYFQGTKIEISLKNKLYNKNRNILIKRIINTHKQMGFSISSYVAESSFFLEGQNVLAEVIEKNLAAYISNTRAIFSKSFEQIPSLVLQKNDGTATALVRYLAFLKSISSINSFNHIVLCSKEKSENIEIILNYAKQLKYILTNSRISVLSIYQQSNEYQSLIIEKSLQYAILRTAQNVEIKLELENSADYFNILKFINKLKNWPEENQNIIDIAIIKMLLLLPLIIEEIQISHDPSTLCTFIENIIINCERAEVWKNKLLAKAVAISLENSLKLLGL